MKKLISAAAIIILYSACKFNGDASKSLPIYGERETTVKTVEGKEVTDTIYHTIPDFSFVNQYGDSVTNKSLDGKIYVADFFFTTCPSICPIMHRNMLTVYNEFKNTPDVKIISFTIDPKHDSVAVLKNYADKLGITGNSWLLLQGQKESTYQLSKSFLVTTPKEDVKEKFIHDGYFILVDKQKRVRGMYNGTDEKEVDKLITDIKSLKAETDQQ
ncbi:MAG: SCO family protein [Sphingobacteriaceae bacterium]|nr:MAG: SCO family protein [Sphingobacteriaceae bacterium]